MQLSIVSKVFIALSLSLISSVSASTGVHCGTTDDATLSDCRDLTTDVGNWNAAFNTGNKCTYFNPYYLPLIPRTAYNVACRGNCCVYVAGYPSSGANIDREQIRREAAGLLGCGDSGKNKINGMQKFEDGRGVCLSNGNGCGDCFDDNDFVNSASIPY